MLLLAEAVAVGVLDTEPVKGEPAAPAVADKADKWR
jgi:hypothetical protein